MKKLVLIIALLMLTTTMLQAGALKNFAGHWMNQDKNTRGLTKLHISVVGRNLQVQTWGKAHPNDSDLGKRIATAYTPSVSTKPEHNTRALVVEYRNSFSHRMVVIKQRGSKHLP
jgi:hypothetical protein